MTREEARAHISAALGQSEMTEFLLDYLEDCWETLDLLTETFGSEQACALLLAHSCLAVFGDPS